MDRSAACLATADSELSDGKFGRHESVLRDGETLVDGLAWSQGRTRLPTHPLSEIRERAELESLDRELPFRPLAIRAETPVHLRRVPWPTTCYAVDDWGHPDALEFLRLHTDVFRYSGFHEAIDAGIPDDADLDRLAEAVALLTGTLPHATVSALAFTRMVLILRTSVPSWYQTQSPFTIGLSQHLVHDEPLLVLAECLLHESLHEKYAILRLTRNLITPSDDDETPKALLPWSLSMGERRMFGVNRMLSTLHVYAHLALFQAGAHALGLGPERLSAERLAINYARGSYIAGKLASRQVEDRLGADGHELRDWLVRHALQPAAQIAAVHEVPVSAFDPSDLDPEELRWT